MSKVVFSRSILLFLHLFQNHKFQYQCSIALSTPDVKLASITDEIIKVLRAFTTWRLSCNALGKTQKPNKTIISGSPVISSLPHGRDCAVTREEGSDLNPKETLDQCLHLGTLCTIISSVYLGAQLYQLINGKWRWLSGLSILCSLATPPLDHEHLCEHSAAWIKHPKMPQHL